MTALDRYGSVDRLGPWGDCNNVGDRANDLMRPNWLLVDEVVALCNAGDHRDDVVEELRDLLAASLDIEKKYAEVRAAETARAIRSWYVRAFGTGYEKELGWV
ncbi:hypothetical protein [Rhodococcus jostii]|uniref:hypothetical protein n=1 Tax=Rhodococcus jostii TaxID=132919 RepID=UPI003632B934